MYIKYRWPIKLIILYIYPQYSPNTVMNTARIEFNTGKKWLYVMSHEYNNFYITHAKIFSSLHIHQSVACRQVIYSGIEFLVPPEISQYITFPVLMDSWRLAYICRCTLLPPPIYRLLSQYMLLLLGVKDDLDYVKYKE